MSTRFLAQAKTSQQASSAVKTSLLKNSAAKQVQVEDNHQQSDEAKQSSFQHDFSQVSVQSSYVPLIQPKLIIGKPSDRYEQEADKVADQVMSMPEPKTFSGTALSIQRFNPKSTQKLQRQTEVTEEAQDEEVVQTKSLSIQQLNPQQDETLQRQAEDTAQEDDEDEEIVQGKSLSSLSIHQLNPQQDETLQRQAEDTAQDDEDEEEVVQTKRSSITPNVNPDLVTRLKASRGGGQPIGEQTRTFMESRFNYDFSQVRVHTDAEANQLAHELNAQAFTWKQDIYFGAGYYQPHKSTGKRLLAHELTHTIQQQATPTLRSHHPDAPPLRVSQPTDSLEHEPESVAHQVAQDSPVTSVTVSEEVPTAQKLISLRRSGSQTTNLVFSLNASVKANVGATLKPSSKPSSSNRANQDDMKPEEAKQDSETEDATPTEEAEAAKSDETVADTAPPEAAQQTPTSPDEDPAFQETLKQIDRTKRTQRQHVPPDRKLGEVKQAAVLPENEQEDKNDRKQHVEAMAITAATVDKEKQPFKPETFKQLLQQNLNALENQLPKDEASARRFKDDKPLEKVKEEIGQQVATENEKVAAPITSQVKQDPPASGLPTQAEKALSEESVGSKPRPIDPHAAAPKPKQDSEISMDEESKKLDAKLSENNMTEEQLRNSGNEQKFQETLKTKQQAQEEAKAAPQRYRQEEEKILAGAEKKAQGAGKNQFDAMVSDRQGAFDTVYSKQVTTEKADEDKQKEVFKGLEKIYNETKDNVSKILTWLSGEVDRIFTEESDKAKKVFEDTVEEKLDDIHGLGIVEFFAGEDTEAIEQVFKEEKEKFLSAMDKTLDKIANLIAEWLNNAIGWIEHGRSESEKLFNGLDKDQQEKSSDALELFTAQYHDLEESVNDKQNELAQTLAESYKSNVDSLRETFNKINEEVKKSWIDKAVEFIEEVANAIAKLADLLQSILQRVASIIGDILAHPILFLENLAAGVKAGFDQFIAGIQGYVVGGFFDWLRGSIGGAGITIPDKLDAAGIFSLVMQVLGLNYDTFRMLAVKILGKEEIELIEKGTGAAEKGLEIFQLIQGKGLIALWDDLKEMIVSSFDSIINQVKETVLFKTIKKALAFIGSLFTPAGAFIKAVQLVYKGLRFLIDNIDRIREVVNAFLDSLELAAKGNPGAIASKIVKALQNFIVLAIDFLAKLLNLGDLAQKVRKILQAIRKPIIRAIEWLLKKVKPIVKRVFKKVKALVKKGKGLVKKAKKKVKALVKKGKKKAKSLVAKGQAVAAKIKNKLLQWLKIKNNFKSKDGGKHKLFLQSQNRRVVAYVASEVAPVQKFLEGRHNLEKDATQKGLISDALTYYQSTVNNQIEEVKRTEDIYMKESEKKAKRSARHEYSKAGELLRSHMKVFAEKLSLVAFSNETDLAIRTDIKYAQKGKRAGNVTAYPLTYLPGEYTGSSPTVNPPGMDYASKSITKWVRGHLLSEHFHGPGDQVWNLTPISESSNSKMQNIEDKVKPLIKQQGTILYYNTKVSYDDNKPDPLDKIPTSIKISWGKLEAIRDNSGKISKYKATEKHPEPAITQTYPDLSGAPNLNALGRVDIEKFSDGEINKNLAFDIVSCRDKFQETDGSFKNFSDLIANLTKYYQDKLTLKIGQTNKKSLTSLTDNKKLTLNKVINVEQKIKIEYGL
ncbi:eCIS core domain-containing protein [Nostoc sp. WHI]|uniref:eCIS core domain-containing protein n=1 Tax=Nostoc sp. WHI TaxID=2650611 RepID=UPI0018C5A350|nr:DUF4157 domain-containing protein [Nostoc sp. WHI]MBG1267342.1 DUF4157 domain-containing protein [Nostoc sp. WHI]